MKKTKSKKGKLIQPKALQIGAKLYADSGTQGPFIIFRDYLGGDLFFYFTAQTLHDWIERYLLWSEEQIKMKETK